MPKRARGFAGTTLLVMSAGFLYLGRPAKADDSVLARLVAAFQSNDEPALQAILRFGRENHIPLGLVTDGPLCSTVIRGLRVEQASAATVLLEFSKRLPSYRWDLEDNTIVLAPDHMPEVVARFLAVTPPPYAIPEEVLQGQVSFAWMNMRAALRPDEGTVLNFLSSPKSEKWPALNLRDLTVRQVLNHLVARAGGGAWVLTPFRDFDKVAEKRPFWVIDYSDRLSERTGTLCPGNE